MPNPLRQRHSFFTYISRDRVVLLQLLSACTQLNIHQASFALPVMSGTTWQLLLTASQKSEQMLLCPVQDCNPSIKALTGECKPFRLASKFACDVDPYKPHQMYPRPQMLRGNDTWINLNGIWEWEANV